MEWPPVVTLKLERKHLPSVNYEQYEIVTYGTSSQVIAMYEEFVILF